MFAVIAVLFYLGIIAFYLYTSWRVFEKAGRKGWEGIVPIYNIYVLIELTGKPIWWLFVMLFFPPVGIVLMILVYIELAHLFGKSTGFGVGLSLLGFIFLPILAFGDATFKGVNTFNNPDVIDSEIL